jgi:hypothetical protein
MLLLLQITILQTLLIVTVIYGKLTNNKTQQTCLLSINAMRVCLYSAYLYVNIVTILE